MRFYLSKAAIAATVTIIWACAHTIPAAHSHEAETPHSSKASDHAPIGVMGDHRHKQGEIMLSYRYMHMDMHGNRSGTNSIDPDTIATTIANRFSAVAGQPPTLRVVPTSMTMEMHMIGAMYAPTDSVTLMAMGMWQEKEMEHITYAGGMGTNILGNFTTNSKGWGDTKFGGLFRLLETKGHNAHLNLSISAPTGAINKTATVLAPNNTRPRLRMPYAMQIGTGTWDLHPGITYYGHAHNWNWGAQYMAELRLEDENSEGYRWGNKHSISLWGAYDWAPWISTSLRLTGTSQSDIKGIDTQIVAPVQTANPDYYGGETLNALFGINLIGTKGTLEGHRLAIEAGAPLYRDFNGPQLETDWTLMIGWQKAF